MDGQPTWTDCDEAGDYVVPNVLSPRDLVFRPDNMDETVPHTHDEAGAFDLVHHRSTHKTGISNCLHTGEKPRVYPIFACITDSTSVPSEYNQLRYKIDRGW